ncbi:MAG: hypothetical protein AAFV87_05465 [Pseudomonadota bacterium]
MKTYHAVLMHGARGGEGRYDFEGDDDLLDRSPVKVMRACMDAIEERPDINHLDYVINAAMKNDEYRVVTVLGDIAFSEENHQPFVCMISEPA